MLAHMWSSSIHSSFSCLLPIGFVAHLPLTLWKRRKVHSPCFSSGGLVPFRIQYICLFDDLSFPGSWRKFDWNLFSFFQAAAESICWWAICIILGFTLRMKCSYWSFHSLIQVNTFRSFLLFLSYKVPLHVLKKTQNGPKYSYFNIHIYFK